MIPNTPHHNTSPNEQTTPPPSPRPTPPPQVLCEGAGFRPRQFEFNPHVSSADPEDEATLVFGTIKGEVVVARLPGGAEQEEEGDETPGAAGGGGGTGVGPRRHPDVVASFLDKPHFLGKDSHDSILGCVRCGVFLRGALCCVGWVGSAWYVGALLHPSVNQSPLDHTTLIIIKRNQAELAPQATRALLSGLLLRRAAPLPGGRRQG